MDRKHPSESSSPEADENAAERARQEALKRLGIFTAYTAPSMMVLMSTKTASGQTVTSGATT